MTKEILKGPKLDDFISLLVDYRISISSVPDYCNPFNAHRILYTKGVCKLEEVDLEEFRNKTKNNICSVESDTSHRIVCLPSRKAHVYKISYRNGLVYYMELIEGRTLKFIY